MTLTVQIQMKQKKKKARYSVQVTKASVNRNKKNYALSSNTIHFRILKNFVEQIEKIKIIFLSD